MTQIISYMMYILVYANGQPTGYTFTYSSNQNSQETEQDASDITNSEDYTTGYPYGG